MEWLEGLPRVKGRYGFGQAVEKGPSFAVRPKGSMDNTLLNDYIERLVMHAIVSTLQRKQNSVMTGYPEG